MKKVEFIKKELEKYQKHSKLRIVFMGVVAFVVAFLLCITLVGFYPWARYGFNLPFLTPVYIFCMEFIIYLLSFAMDARKEKKKEQKFFRLHPNYAEILEKAKGEKNEVLQKDQILGRYRNCN